MLDQLQSTLIDQTAQLTSSARRDAASRAAIDAASKSGDMRKAREAAIEFEATFISQMLEQMFNTVPTDGLFGGGHSEAVFRTLLNEEYGKAIANGRGIGIADHVMNHIIRIQEAQQ